MGNNFLGDIPGSHSYTVETPVVALGTEYKQAIWKAPFACTVTSVKILPQAAVTGNTTNNFSVNILNGGQVGTSTTSVAVKEYNTGVDSVALTEETLTLSGTAANLVLAAGDWLVWSKTEDGSGLATVHCAVAIEVTPV